MSTKSGSRSERRRTVIAAVVSTAALLVLLAALAAADLMHKDRPKALFSVTVFGDDEGGALLLSCGGETALVIDGDDSDGEVIEALTGELRERRQLSTDVLLIKGSADNAECSASLKAAGLEAEEVRFALDTELTLGVAAVILDTADNGAHVINVDHRDGDISITGDADTLCVSVNADGLSYTHNSAQIAVLQSDGKNVRILRDLDALF